MGASSLLGALPDLDATLDLTTVKNSIAATGLEAASQAIVNSANAPSVGAALRRPEFAN